MTTEFQLDIYIPNDKQNSSGTTSQKKIVNYSEFEKIFVGLPWDDYEASPTIAVHDGTNILWVALFASEDDETRTRMYIVSHRYQKAKKKFFGGTKLKDIATTHFMIENETVLSLFKSYFSAKSLEEILEALDKHDGEFLKETGGGLKRMEGANFTDWMK